VEAQATPSQAWGACLQLLGCGCGRGVHHQDFKLTQNDVRPDFGSLCRAAWGGMFTACHSVGTHTNLHSMHVRVSTLCHTRTGGGT
jgi:hypothetical protein